MEQEQEMKWGGDLYGINSEEMDVRVLGSDLIVSDRLLGHKPIGPDIWNNLREQRSKMRSNLMLGYAPATTADVDLDENFATRVDELLFTAATVVLLVSLSVLANATLQRLMPPRFSPPPVQQELIFDVLAIPSNLASAKSAGRILLSE